VIWSHPRKGQYASSLFSPDLDPYKLVIYGRQVKLLIAVEAYLFLKMNPNVIEVAQIDSNSELKVQLFDIQDVRSYVL
jgi:hypothetical protein